MTTLAGTAYRRTVGVAGEPTAGRATALVAVVMCLAAVSETSYRASNGGLGEVPTVAALFVLPLLYVIPATRPLWLRHRYLLLAAQAALTYLPFIWFGADWAPSGVAGRAGLADGSVAGVVVRGGGPARISSARSCGTPANTSAKESCPDRLRLSTILRASSSDA